MNRSPQCKYKFYVTSRLQCKNLKGVRGSQSVENLERFKTISHRSFQLEKRYSKGFEGIIYEPHLWSIKIKLDPLSHLSQQNILKIKKKKISRKILHTKYFQFIRLKIKPRKRSQILNQDFTDNFKENSISKYLQNISHRNIYLTIGLLSCWEQAPINWPPNWP